MSGAAVDFWLMSPFLLDTVYLISHRGLFSSHPDRKLQPIQTKRDRAATHLLFGEERRRPPLVDANCMCESARLKEDLILFLLPRSCP